MNNKIHELKTKFKNAKNIQQIIVGLKQLLTLIQTNKIAQKKLEVVYKDFPEECFVCEEGILSPKIETVDKNYPDGTVITLNAQIYYCNNCNHRIPPNEVDEAFTNEYNRLKKIPSIEEVATTIKKICTQTSLSTEEIASCLGWGKKTFYRWKHHIPSRPYWDILLFLEKNPEQITKARNRGAPWLCEEKSKMSTNL